MQGTMSDSIKLTKINVMVGTMFAAKRGPEAVKEVQAAWERAAGAQAGLALRHSVQANVCAASASALC